MNVADLIMALEKIADQSLPVWFFDADDDRVSVDRLIESEYGVELDANQR